MISVGSRDWYGGIEGGKMELESEFEEGEAYFHNNNKYDDYDDDDDGNDDGGDDDSRIDPDISLSYIDEKIQDVLGHCQKEFEGGVSAEKLGSKFGGYGSFLPTYQRSPVLPQSKTPPNVLTYSAPISPNNAFVEVGHHNPVSQSSASQHARLVPAPPRRPNTNGRSKQDGPASSTTHGEKSTSNGPQTVNDDGSDQKSLKVRIRVGPDNSSNTRNAEIYSGLGLDVSPSSSLEISPVDSDGFFHGPRDGPDESPTSILEMMTSFPICGSRLLSPLPYDILHLTEKKSEDSVCGPIHRTSQESSVTALHGSDSGKPDQNAPGEKPKSSETNTVSMESTNGIDVRNETEIITKTETEQVNGNKGSAGKVREANEENNSGFPTKADSDVSSGSKTRYVKKPRDGEKDRKFHDGMKSGHGSKTSSLDGKRKPKSYVDGSKSGKNNHRSKSCTEDFKKNSGNVRETTYKDVFGELDLEPEDPDLEKRSRNEKGTVENKVVKKSEKPSLYPRGGSHVPLVGNGVGSGAGVTTVVPVVNEDWVCCDKCEKWRLLPPGVNPGSLPEKWLCSMLDWLPGMNRCSISEEETTRAITSRFPGPSLVQGSQPVHPGGPQLDASCPEGRNRHFSSEIPSSCVTKKHESEDLTNEVKQERPSLSSNSAKKNLHTSYRSRSLTGGNRSPRVNESEFQDSGQSRDVIAEKEGLKRKENNKLRENVVNEGNNKRASTQDFPRDFKKAKTDAIHGPDEDRISDHGGAVFKPSCSSSSGLPPDISRKDHGKLDQRPKDTKPASKDVAKKRKLNEFEGTDKYVKEASENNGRKEKRSRVLSKPNDEGKNATVAATSSSSKVSGSRKTKPDNEETKGSPVESVSSSPLRILNTDKFMSSKRNEKIVPENKDKEKIQSFSGGGVGTSGHGNRVETSSHGHNSNGPRSRKHGKGSSSRSKEKNRSRYEITEKGTPQIPEPLNKNVNFRASQEKPKEGRKPDKLVNGAKTHGESNRIDAVSSRDPKQLSKQDVSGKGKPQSLPPKGQNGTERLPEPIPGYPKENAGKPNKKAQNPNGKQPISTKNSTPDVNGGGNKEGPLTVVRDISNQRDIANQATTTALREATNLKHMADRMKNSGSSLESRALYIQAALKFLHVASLFETCHSQTGRYGDMIQSVSIYGSTAKLCEYCAHEFERTKEMATASLAYKCMEVAYLKVIYSSHATACKDVNELQTSLPIGPTGESPSSSASASDLDNMNNPSTVDKAAVPKGLNAPQVAGNHVITARNKPNFMRILNFTQDVNSAMEASRKSRSCFAASNAKEEAIQSAVKKALDFNFHDVKELLRLSICYQDCSFRKIRDQFVIIEVTTDVADSISIRYICCTFICQLDAFDVFRI
ncbi:hypothetical protein OSB04_022742 [Centaurea solstitialis]|uniref:CW-type domain-containing protein n=1 Tax=Centaurea solstitialis TaxID=347529 RepID=A0AA38W8S1_9ASTR|nr:hypothetical protein OSB04_022742 [Centaurea solstitialis]